MNGVLKAAGTTDFSNVFAGDCSSFVSVRADHVKWKDIWTTSVYSFADGASTPGGGRADDVLKVGGWGDWYYSLLAFDASVMPKTFKTAFLVFYSQRVDGTAVMMNVDRITGDWGWAVNDRLWWKDRPPVVAWGTAPAPRRNTWYPLDITGLYAVWVNNTAPNYGLQLRPVQNNNAHNNFVSSRGDKNKIPRLVVCS